MAIRLGKMKINRLWMLVAMALVLGLLATWLAVTYLRNREQAMQVELSERAKGGQTVTVIVPTSDLPKGTVLNESMVAGREIAADLVYAQTVRADQFDQIAGKPLLAPVLRGRPLMREQVIDDKPMDFSSLLTVGMRAITVDIDELNSIAQMLRPGDFIDLNLISTDVGAPAGQSGQQIFPFLQRVKVIATGTRVRGMSAAAPQTPQSGVPDSFNTVTVEVTPEEAAVIALAQTSGRIRTTLRSPEDKALANYGMVTTAQLLGGRLKPGAPGGSASGRPLTGVKVEYIVGGKGGDGAAAPITVNVPGLQALAGAAAAGGAPGAGGTNIGGLPTAASQMVGSTPR